MYNMYVCTYLSVISTSALESFRTTSHTIACTLWIAIPFDTHRSPIYVRNLDIKGNVTSHNFKMVLKIEQCSVRIDTCLLYTSGTRTIRTVFAGIYGGFSILQKIASDMYSSLCKTYVKAIFGYINSLLWKKLNSNLPACNVHIGPCEKTSRRFLW